MHRSIAILISIADLNIKLHYLTGLLPGVQARRYGYGYFGYRRFRSRNLNFVWDNGSPALYTNWKFASLVYATSNPYVSVEGATGFWAQTSSFSYIPSICEKEKGMAFIFHFSVRIIDFY